MFLFLLEYLINLCQQLLLLFSFKQTKDAPFHPNACRKLTVQNENDLFLGMLGIQEYNGL